MAIGPRWLGNALSRRRRSSRHPKRWYAAGVTVLLVLGVGGEMVGYGLLHDESSGRSLILGLSEALLISGLLAVVVDPFLKRRIQEESAWTGIFGFLNDRAPSGLRKALKELAVCDVFFPKTTWALNFAWEDRIRGVLAVTISVRSTGENISRKPHKLDGRLWILASTDGFRSKYLRYAASCPEAFDSIDVRDDQLQAFVSTRVDGSLVLDEWEVSGRSEIPAGKTFEIAREARMFRHHHGYVPLQHSRFGEDLQIVLQGEALRDVEVRVIHPRDDGKQQPSEKKRKPATLEKPVVYKFYRTTPGQVTIVSWKPSFETPGGVVS